VIWERQKLRAVLEEVFHQRHGCADFTGRPGLERSEHRVAYRLRNAPSVENGPVEYPA
jgi:hypothetical protein